MCHGCYDAPCQLQMGSYESITRGSNKTKVYAMRLLEVLSSRLFLDGQSNAEWRWKGFNPVLNEREPEANLEAGVMARMLKLKGQYHFPAGKPLPDKQFDFSLDRDQQCPAIEEFDVFAKAHPDWGMPYGLPALQKKEEQILLRWLEAGAPAEAAKPLAQPYLERVAQWEAFLNGGTLKEQLMARYIYEHWFLDEPYRVTQLPSYAPDIASNPFVAFQQIPVRSRYRLLLDEAQFTVMGFIKGPVCRGQVALNVITDHFDPETTDFLAKELKEVRLPNEQTNSLRLWNWLGYSKQETSYLRAKSGLINQRLVGDNRPNLSMLWDGDGKNRNAAADGLPPF